MPVVALLNSGTIEEVSDGTTFLARTIDERFGAGRPGRVFVTGTGDDGGFPNHAAGTVGAGETVDLRVRKASAGPLRLRLWYNGADRFDASLVTPSGTFGPYAAPPTANDRDTRQEAEFFYAHNGAAVDYARAASDTREIFVVLTGPAGDYALRLTGGTVADGGFHAWLNPAAIYSGQGNRFESFVEPGFTVWSAAAAVSNIAPNSYVLRHEYTDIDGNRRVIDGQGAIGDLWVGSGVGPTVDGRLGVTVSAPGEVLFAPYAPHSFFATGRFNIVFDGGDGGLYGLQSAVSAAAPVTTGIIALLLQADPTLDAEEVKDVLQRTARQDEFTGETPNTRWGYGKIDAYAAALAVQSATAGEPGAERGGVALDVRPNPLGRAGTLVLTLPAPAEARVDVLDLLGRRVAQLHVGPLGAGEHAVPLDLTALPAGAYVVRAGVGGAVRTRLVTVAR